MTSLGRLHGGFFFNAHNELEDFQESGLQRNRQPFFDSIGWTELDLGLFKNWYFMDPDTYSLETPKTERLFPPLRLR